jgi:CO/xanthine dehydrogenase Mo-binding subunit
MSELKYIGKSIPRPDSGDKATGKAHYIHDLSRPGMLYGKIKFSEHAHAKILNIDISKAQQLPGVMAVVTAYNTPEMRFGFLRDNFILKKNKVRQFRDEVAAVAAISPDIAEEAISLIKVEYEPLPGIFTPEEACKENAILIHEFDPQGKPQKDNKVPVLFQHSSGNIEDGKKAARHIVSGEFSTQWIQQSCMGTAGAIAEFDMNNNLTIWTKTQVPFLAQRDFLGFLPVLGLKEKNVRVIVPTLGGAFGTGLDTHAYEYICILLAFKTGKPVKIVYDRNEEFACLSPRQSSQTRITQGCDENGKLTFREIEVTQDNGAYTSWGATFPSVMLLPATSLYRVPNIKFHANIIYTNNTYCQAMRGYGNPEVNWALETNMDELAELVGIDPYDFRMINCNKSNETTPMGLKVTTCALDKCMESVANKLDWKHSRNQKSKYRGVGMASLFHVGGGGRIYKSDGTGMFLKLDDFGNVYVSHGGVEMGQGLHSVLKLGVAEALGVKPDKVFINQVDTYTCPWDVGTHASRGSFMAGNVTIRAASELRSKIFEHAKTLFPSLVEKNLKSFCKKNPDYKAPQFDVREASQKGNFDLIDGYLFIKDAPKEPWLQVDLGTLLRAIHFREQGTMLSSQAFYDPPNELPDWDKGYGNMSAAYAVGAQGAEVEVDIETGEVKILRMVAVHDVGKVLNPQTLKGQMYGALAQGLGYTLYEQILTKNGKILNPDFRDYKIPTFKEMDFPIDLEFVETNDSAGPWGAKGVGESGLCPTAPAISNAIYNAVGIRVRDLPITPEKVLAALQEQRKQKKP